MTYNYAGSIEIYGNCVFVLSFSGKCLFYNNNKKTMCSSRAIHRLFYDLFYHLKSTRIASSNSWIINQTSKYIFGCVGFIDQFACIFIFGMYHLDTSVWEFSCWNIFWIVIRMGSVLSESQPNNGHSAKLTHFDFN